MSEFLRTTADRVTTKLFVVMHIDIAVGGDSVTARFVDHRTRDLLVAYLCQIRPVTTALMALQYGADSDVVAAYQRFLFCRDGGRMGTAAMGAAFKQAMIGHGMPALGVAACGQGAAGLGRGLLQLDELHATEDLLGAVDLQFGHQPPHRPRPLWPARWGAPAGAERRAGVHRQRLVARPAGAPDDGNPRPVARVSAELLHDAANRSGTETRLCRLLSAAFCCYLVSR